MKVFFCKCGQRLYIFPSDRDGQEIRCIHCGKFIKIDRSVAIDEFDYEKYPRITRDDESEGEKK